MGDVFKMLPRQFDVTYTVVVPSDVLAGDIVSKIEQLSGDSSDATATWAAFASVLQDVHNATVTAVETIMDPQVITEVRAVSGETSTTFTTFTTFTTTTTEIIDTTLDTAIETTVESTTTLSVDETTTTSDEELEQLTLGKGMSIAMIGMIVGGSATTLVVCGAVFQSGGCSEQRLWLREKL